MNKIDSTWEQRVADLWKAIDDYPPDVFVAQMDALAAQLPPHSAAGLFERGSAQDSTGHSDLAVPLYRAALNAGLTGLPRRRATIQMGSSMRNLGDAQEAADLLATEARTTSDELDGAVQAFLALALADLGREREALAISLTALSRYLPQYNRSLANYASEIAQLDAAAHTLRIEMFDHVKFGVSDYAASKAFFLKALEPLGVAVGAEWPPNGVELVSPKSKASLCFYQTEEKPAHLHLAFMAENRQQVEAFYRAALEAGGKDNGAPGLRPRYHANYYAAFVIGPDGHNIEVVCHEPGA